MAELHLHCLKVRNQSTRCDATCFCVCKGSYLLVYVHDRYGRDNSFRQMVDVQMVAAMGPPGGGRAFVTDRLLRHFNTLACAQVSIWYRDGAMLQPVV